MVEDLKKIKKLYGENMMHLCRDLFPTLLEQEGLLPKVLTEKFYPFKFLYDDLKSQHQEEKFKDYIYDYVECAPNNLKDTNKTPQELLNEVGYDLYECHTEEDIQRFKKYYEENEELCTFNGGRLNSCHVFFAVKKNVDEIKREDFPYPQRQDEYGTSVISIQFTRGNINTLSIKNRYNHTVNNPDATFSNNLEKIVPGLTKSFEKKYNLNINPYQGGKFELENYVQDARGKFYRYNYEEGNIYYCPNNIVIFNFEPIEFDHERYILLDYFLLNLKYKMIKLCDKSIGDSFVDGIKNIDNIIVTKSKKNGNKDIKITTEDENTIYIEIDKLNRIVGYKNEKLTEIGNSFLCLNRTLKTLELPNLVKIGDSFLSRNANQLSELHLPSLVEVGFCFIGYNHTISTFTAPNLKKVGNSFLEYNKELTSLDLPNLTTVGHNFLYDNATLSTFNAPKLETVGSYFLFKNENLTYLELPSLVNADYNFLKNNEDLSTFIAPMLSEAGSSFLSGNKELVRLELPCLIQVRKEFLRNNCKLTELLVPRLVYAGNDFLANNNNLSVLEAPNLKTIGDSHASSHPIIKKMYYQNKKKQQEDLYETTIVDVSKEENQISKETPKVRCKNGK